MAVRRTGCTVHVGPRFRADLISYRQRRREYQRGLLSHWAGGRLCALELSKNSWLLAIQFPDRNNPILDPIKGDDTGRLMARLEADVADTLRVRGLMPILEVHSTENEFEL